MSTRGYEEGCRREVMRCTNRGDEEGYEKGCRRGVREGVSTRGYEKGLRGVRGV